MISNTRQYLDVNKIGDTRTGNKLALVSEQVFMIMY